MQKVGKQYWEEAEDRDYLVRIELNSRLLNWLNAKITIMRTLNNLMVERKKLHKMVMHLFRRK